MKKQFLLAAVTLSLLLLGYGILWPGGSVAMPMPLETPMLTIDKEVAEELVTDLDGDGKVDPGDTISYTITYENTGNAEATNVVVVDDYPETLIANIDNIIDGEDDGSAITWQLDILAPRRSGSVSYEVTVKATLPPGTTAIRNEARIHSNEVEWINAALTVPVQRPALTIAKASETIDLDKDGVIGGGDIISYEITYENTGDAEATNVIVVDDYPETLIASMDNISGDGKDDGSAITWELGTVEAGEKALLTYKVTLRSKFPPGTTSVDNRAEIRSDETSPVGTEQSVPIINLPNLTITKERALDLVDDLNKNGNPDPGDTLKYDIAYENRGDADATQVIIVDDYDQTFIETIAKITGDYTDDGDTITWELDTLAPEETGSVSYEATLKETFPLGSTDVQNEVTISSKETEATSATVTAKVEVTPTPTPIPVPAPTLAGATAGEKVVRWSAILTGLIICGGFVLVALLAIWGKMADLERGNVLRDGFIITVVVGGVLALSLAGLIEHSASAGILGTVAGYLLKSVPPRREPPSRQVQTTRTPTSEQTSQPEEDR